MPNIKTPHFLLSDLVFTLIQSSDYTTKHVFPHFALLCLLLSKFCSDKHCYYDPAIITLRLLNSSAFRFSAHALGFYHEQSRPDRDQFIQVNLGNVIAGEWT